MKLSELSIDYKEQLVKIRRYLHQYPEPSMEEFETAAYVRDFLTSHGINWIPAGLTGTVAIIQGTKAKPVIGLRGDIDALEMDELNHVP